jgi:uncharacterized membrane protein
MAGIGFELRQLTSDQSLFGVIRANVYSALLSSGAWVISISLMFLIYSFLEQALHSNHIGIEFLVAITYLTSGSLMVSGLFQHIAVRYLADQLYINKPERIAGFILAVVIVLSISSFFIGWLGCRWLAPDLSVAQQGIMVASFVTLNLMWLLSSALAGLKIYRLMLLAFFLSYLLTFYLVMHLYQFQLTGLLIAYYVGQVCLVLVLFIHFLRSFPMQLLVNFRTIRYCKNHTTLLLTGVMSQLAFWIDKYLFWFSDKTGVAILSGLKASPIYDLPMFVAFISMIPGLAVFFYEMEANFSLHYHRLYDVILTNANYDDIRSAHKRLISSAREAFLTVIKIQGLIAVIMMLFAPKILTIFHLSPILIFIFRVDLLAVFLVVLILGLINFLFYLNKAKEVALLTSVFFLSNLILTLVTLNIDPAWYGYGFLGSGLITVVFGLNQLNQAFSRQIYAAFMTH